MRYTSEQLNKIAKHLETAREAATLERASFFHHEADGERKNQELKDRVRLHHDTWIVKQIEAALDILREQGKK